MGIIHTNKKSNNKDTQDKKFYVGVDIGSYKIFVIVCAVNSSDTNQLIPPVLEVVGYAKYEKELVMGTNLRDSNDLRKIILSTIEDAIQNARAKQNLDIIIDQYFINIKEGKDFRVTQIEVGDSKNSKNLTIKDYVRKMENKLQNFTSKKGLVKKLYLSIEAPSNNKEAQSYELLSEKNINLQGNVIVNNPSLENEFAKLFNEISIKNFKFIHGHLALCLSLIPNEYKNNEACIIDFGEYVTQVIFYRDGKLIYHSDFMQDSAYLITKDVACVYTIPLIENEEEAMQSAIKMIRVYNTVWSDSEATLEYRNQNWHYYNEEDSVLPRMETPDSDDVRYVNVKNKNHTHGLQDIIEARIQLGFERIAKQLQQVVPFKTKNPAIILCGGAVNIPNLLNIVEKAFISNSKKVIEPLTLSVPKAIDKSRVKTSMDDSEWLDAITAIGTITYGISLHQIMNESEQKTTNSISSLIKSTIKNITQ